MPTHPISQLAEIADRRLRQAQAKSPGAARLSQLFETMYYTSLKTEEGKPLQVRIACLDPSNPDPGRPQLVRPDRWVVTRLREIGDRKLEEIGDRRD